ncbi:MAG: hypothetical protein BGO78_03050 [Chloroflexi bacterium 44-23]|nr:MAG: hypothetical protein BGO78_03050 [Chloroflexi bacterium 44-23]
MIDNTLKEILTINNNTKTSNLSQPHSKLLIRNLGLKVFVHLIGLLPFIELLIRWQTNQLTVNPIQFIEQSLGLAAINLIIVGLAITPFITITGWKQPGRHRRTIGLYAALYVILHFLTFIGLDFGFDLNKLARQLFEKPFIIVGSLAALIVFALAVTSFKYWKRKLGKKWKILHRTIYFAALLAVIHYAWALKGSVSNLSGDVIRPIIYGFFVVFLLLMRITTIKNWVIAKRIKLLAGR